MRERLPAQKKAAPSTASGRLSYAAIPLCRGQSGNFPLTGDAEKLRHILSFFVSDCIFGISFYISEIEVTERAEHIEEWRKLTGEIYAKDLQKPQRGRPATTSASLTARELGISHTAVQNAAKIASLPDDVKQQAREERWPATRLMAEAVQGAQVGHPLAGS